MSKAKTNTDFQRCFTVGGAPMGQRSSRSPQHLQKIFAAADTEKCLLMWLHVSTFLEFTDCISLQLCSKSMRLTCPIKLLSLKAAEHIFRQPDFVDVNYLKTQICKFGDICKSVKVGDKNGEMWINCVKFVEGYLRRGEISRTARNLALSILSELTIYIEHQEISGIIYKGRLQLIHWELLCIGSIFVGSKFIESRGTPASIFSVTRKSKYSSQDILRAEDIIISKCHNWIPFDEVILMRIYY